jgi:D-3-phosphoglycerate dehydrogenase / 2-oxoglutarate reductase
MPRVVLTDSDRFPFRSADLQRLSSAGVDVSEVPGHDARDIAAAAKGCHAVFVFSGKFDAALLKQLVGCRVIARCGVGYDNIDIAAAHALGMTVTYVPDYGAEDVADHAIALVLSCARRLSYCDRAVHDGLWPSFADLGPMRRIAGRTLGLIGYGQIARHVAARARALKMEVLAHDPLVDQDAGVLLGVSLVSLTEVLGASHFVSVHVPLRPATRHLIDATAIAKMRPDSYLINTSRGAVVDEDALVAALDAGQISGAALDVLEQEPPPAESPILRQPNVLVTPHSAAFTQEAFGDLCRTAITDVLLVLRGSPPRFPVPELAAWSRAGPRPDGRGALA